MAAAHAAPHRRLLGRQSQSAADRLQAQLARHAKAALFKHKDQMLEPMPIGVIVFPRSGIQDNLSDKARKRGIPIWSFDESVA